MGTWGPGVYENDDALNYVGHASDQILRDIASMILHESDDDGEIVAAIDILFKIDPDVLPRFDLKRVVAWRDRCLDEFDAWVALQQNARERDRKYALERRVVLAQTLNRFVSAVERGPRPRAVPLAPRTPS